MAEVQLGDHDPNAKDTVIADQKTVSQIEGEQQQVYEQDLQEIEAAVVGVFDPSVETALRAQATAAMGRGYVFSPVQVDGLVRRAQDQSDRLRSYQQMIEPIQRIDLAPAPDQAGSVMQASAVTKSFENLNTRIKSQINFLTDWINKLNRAKQNYMQQEHLTEEEWKNLTLG